MMREIRGFIGEELEERKRIYFIGSRELMRYNMSVVYYPCPLYPY